MASVQITIPDALVPRLVTMARARFPQHSALGDAALFRRVTADYWRDLLVGYEADRAVTTGQANEQAIIAAVTAQVRADAAGIA